MLIIKLKLDVVILLIVAKEELLPVESKMLQDDNVHEVPPTADI